MTQPDNRQRIADATTHIKNRQQRAVTRFKLWAKLPDEQACNEKELDNGL